MWEETPLFTERERAALTWAEAVTNVQDSHVSDAAYGIVRESFTQQEIVELTMAIVVINSWNRLMVSFRG